MATNSQNTQHKKLRIRTQSPEMQGAMSTKQEMNWRQTSKGNHFNWGCKADSEDKSRAKKWCNQERSQGHQKRYQEDYRSHEKLSIEHYATLTLINAKFFFNQTKHLHEIFVHCENFEIWLKCFCALLEKTNEGKLRQYWGMDLCGVEASMVKLAITNVFLQGQENYLYFIIL